MNSKFASRAGEKLEFALEKFEINVSNLVCADLGCSTGGFTDCLLQNGAAKVYSIDTAYGELAWKLRTNPKVVVMERTNALHVELPEKVDFISIDVSWTKQKMILPKAISLLKSSSHPELARPESSRRVSGSEKEIPGQARNDNNRGGIIISLLKPHYEAEEYMLEKGKLKEEFVQKVIDEAVQELKVQGINVNAIIESPIEGKKGANKEFLMLMRK